MAPNAVELAKAFLRNLDIQVSDVDKNSTLFTLDARQLNGDLAAINALATMLRAACALAECPLQPNRRCGVQMICNDHFSAPPHQAVSFVNVNHICQSTIPISPEQANKVRIKGVCQQNQLPVTTTTGVCSSD